MIPNANGAIASDDGAKAGGATAVVTDAIQGDVLTGEYARNIKADTYIEKYGYTAEEVALLIAELRRPNQPKVWDGRQPYKGLVAFQQGDAPFFFGRETLVTELLQRVAQDRFVCVAGPSGSGKSSLVQAGVIPALQRGAVADSDKWLMATFTPLGDPIEQMARAMARVAQKPEAAIYLRQYGSKNDTALHEQAEVLLSADPRQRLLLFVDQFEELFIQTRDISHRNVFIALLTTAIQQMNGRVTVILGLRSDFISECASYPDLRVLINQGFQLVGAMDRHELVRAVTLPALEVGITIDPELVSRIIADVKGEPGALPLMQFALLDLFKATVTKAGVRYELTLTQYLERGGLDQALERHANAVLAQLEQQGDEYKAVVRRIFKAVVETRSNRVDTRRSVVISELLSPSIQPAVLNTTIDLLSGPEARLITAGGDNTSEVQGDQARTVTLAHEKLIDAWPWLNALIEQNRKAIALQNQLNDDVRQWDGQGRSAEWLYLGTKLADVVAQQANLELSEDAFLFIKASQQRDQRNRFLRIGIPAAFLLLIFITLVVSILFQDKIISERTEAAATIGAALYTNQHDSAIRNANEANQTILQDPAESIALVMTALPPPPPATRIPYVPAAEKVLLQAWRANQERAYLTLSQLPLHSAQISGGREGIAIGSDQLVFVDHAIQQTLTTMAGMGNIDGVVWGSEWLVTYDDTLLQLWRVQRLGIELMKEYRFADPIACAAWRLPDQRDLAICSGTHLWLWETPFAGEPTALPNQFPAPVREVSWSSDGKRLAAWDEGWVEKVRTQAPAATRNATSNATEETIVIHSTLLVYNMAEQSTVLFNEAAHDAGIWNAIWSPDNQNLVTTANDGVVRIRQVDTINRYVSTILCPGVIDVHFLTNDRFLTWNSNGGGVLTWMVDGQLAAESAVPDVCVTGPDETPHIENVLFPAEGWQLHLWSDGKLDLLSASGEDKIHLEGHASPVSSAALLTDRYLATGDKAGMIYLWDVQESAPQPLMILRGHSNNVRGERSAILWLQWQADGRHLLSIGEDGTLRQWQLLDQWGEPLCNGLTADGAPICFDPESTYLAHRAEINTAQWISDTAFVSVDKQYHVYRWVLGQQKPLTLSTTAYTAFWLDPELLVSEIRDSKAITPGNVLLVDPENGAVLTKLDGYDAFVTAAARHVDGQIATGEWDGRVRTWYADRTPAMERLNGDCSNTETTEAVADCTASHANVINRVQWNRAGTRLLVSGRNVVLWDLAQPKPTPLWVWPNEKSKAYAALSEDDALVAIAVEKLIYILDANSGEMLDPQHPAFAGGFTQPILGLQWLTGAKWPNQQDPPDQPANQQAQTTRPLLFAWSGDGSARLWDWSISHTITSTTEILYLSERMGVVGEPFRITAASISPDGKHILTAAHGFTMVGEVFNEQGILRVWRSWHTDPAALLLAAQERIRHRSTQ